VIAASGRESDASAFAGFRVVLKRVVISIKQRYITDDTPVGDDYYVHSLL
jgi:hypothetical protein